jgi:hypothetical protein
MSEILPVYQMGFSNDKSKLLNKSVKFITELIDYESQDFIHLIPVINHKGDISKLINFLKKRIYKFPSLINNNEVLLYGKFSFPYIKFRIPKTLIEIRFKVIFSIFESDTDTITSKEQAKLFKKYLLKELKSDRKKVDKSRKRKHNVAVELSGDRKTFLSENLLNFRYTGNSKLVLRRGYTLMAIVPESIDNLTYFYTNHKLITVGMTPMFGVNEEVHIEK